MTGTTTTLQFAPHDEIAAAQDQARRRDMAKMKTPQVQANGWTDWQSPVMSGYRMGCCDCGLVHDMEFRVVRVTRTLMDGSWSYREVDGAIYRVMMRAKRNNRSTSALRRKHRGGGGMWRSGATDWPSLGQTVIGIMEREDGFDEVSWWTRTEDGWYVSDVRGNLGHRDAFRPAESEGPTWWSHAPWRRTETPTS